MSRREISICDRCGAPDITPAVLLLTVGYTDNEHSKFIPTEVRVDLCPGCASDMLRALNRFNIEESARLIETIKAYRSSTTTFVPRKSAP